MTAIDSLTDLRPGPQPRTVKTAEGDVLEVPAGWERLDPGDAGLTRAVKAMGPSWAVAEKRGRKSFSRGLWAPEANILKATADMEAKRADPAYQRRLDAGRARRAKEQVAYVQDFQAEVLAFLDFAPRHEALAADLAARVTTLATPVGSGTVARTERIPVEKRAEAAVIAWMRHQTTAYDNMSVARVKGARRALRRQLAERSRAVLQRYRRGEDPAADCPLAVALARPAPAAPGEEAPKPERKPLPTAPWVAARRASGSGAGAGAAGASVRSEAAAARAALFAPRDAREAEQAALAQKVRERRRRGS